MSIDPSGTVDSLQSDILEAIATGVNVDEVVERLCRRAEACAPDTACAICYLDGDRGHISRAVTSSLGRSYVGRLVGTAVDLSVAASDTGAGPETPPRGIELPLPDGWAASWARLVHAPDGHPVALFMLFFRDARPPREDERAIAAACVRLAGLAIGHQRMQHRNLELAHYDQLTALRNRRCFDEMIESELLKPTPSLALLMVDIDHLKTINDSMGHMVGDEVIKEVAARMERIAVAAGASSYRLSGDEFAVVAGGDASQEAQRQLAEKILKAVEAPFPCRGNMIMPRVTIGGVVLGPDGDDADSLRQNADFALYHGKEAKRGGYVAFEPGLRSSILRRIETIREVDIALAEHRIFPNYQPVVRLDTGKIVGLEALARMQTRDGELLSAGQFIDAFSDPGIADRLTKRILRQVAADIRYWLDEGIPFQHVGINLSMSDFRRSNLDRIIADAFGTENVSLKHVVLEVTETVFMDGPDNDIARAVSRLRDQGMLVALDDFGTGYASLTHLLSFPVDIIKIDKSFVDRLLTDPPSGAIVEALIGIAEKLDMRIVAEGIECSGQAERLRELGCQLGQGFHFARPADAESTTHLLRHFAQQSPPDESESRQGTDRPARHGSAPTADTRRAR